MKCCSCEISLVTVLTVEAAATIAGVAHEVAVYLWVRMNSYARETVSSTVAVIHQAQASRRWGPAAGCLGRGLTRFQVLERHGGRPSSLGKRSWWIWGDKQRKASEKGGRLWPSSIEGRPGAEISTGSARVHWQADLLCVGGVFLARGSR